MIEQERGLVSIKHACSALGVSVSGYYAWRGRPESEHTITDRQLSERITQLFFANRQVYGTPRIWEELKAEGIAVSPKRVARLLREAGLSAVVKRKRIVTTKSNRTHPVAPNLLARAFTADKPNAKWCGDIT